MPVSLRAENPLTTAWRVPSSQSGTGRRRVERAGIAGAGDPRRYPRRPVTAMANRSRSRAAASARTRDGRAPASPGGSPACPAGRRRPRSPRPRAHPPEGALERRARRPRDRQAPQSRAAGCPLGRRRRVRRRRSPARARRQAARSAAVARAPRGCGSGSAGSGSGSGSSPAASKGTWDSGLAGSVASGSGAASGSTAGGGSTLASASAASAGASSAAGLGGAVLVLRLGGSDLTACRPKRLFLLALELILRRAMLALELDVLADRIVENAHRAGSLSRHRGRVRAALP